MPAGPYGPQITDLSKRLSEEATLTSCPGLPVSSSKSPQRRLLLAHYPTPDQHVARMTEPHFLNSARAQIGRDRRAGAQSCQMRPAHFLLQHLTGAKRRIALGFLGFLRLV